MLTPKDIAVKVMNAGEAKANMNFLRLFVLGIMAGVFIGLAGAGSLIASKYGGKIAGAAVFPIGLLMVVAAGSELFTGNNLMMVALLNKKIGWSGMLKNWTIVFCGNFIGALIVALFVVASGVLDGLADNVMTTAVAKENLGFGVAMIRGILCNFLVCVAVWMAFGAKSLGGKAVAVFAPVMLFVLCGFEHSVANMFYGPAGIIMGLYQGADIGFSLMDFCMNNLLPVTLGNVIGGALVVGVIYGCIYGGQGAKE